MYAFRSFLLMLSIEPSPSFETQHSQESKKEKILHNCVPKILQTNLINGSEHSSGLSASVGWAAYAWGLMVAFLISGIWKLLILNLL